MPAATRRAMPGIRGLALLVAGAFAAVAPRSLAAGGLKRSPEGLERRHRIGLQIGGSGFVQPVYRYRAAGPLHLELGALGAPHGLANMSLGVIVGSPLGSRLFPYAGLGGAFAGVASQSGPDCPWSSACVRSDEVLSFFYARFGMGLVFGDDRQHLIALEVGAWLGRHTDTERRGLTIVSRTAEPFLWPTAGLGYLYAF